MLKKLKKIKKKKNWIRIACLGIFILFILGSVGPVTGADYSYYMKARDLDIEDDPNRLLYENGTETNQFRNKMESNLRVARNNYFGLNQPPLDSKTGYAINQFYFDDLTEDRAFDSNAGGQETEGFEEALYGTDNYELNNGTVKSDDKVKSGGKWVSDKGINHNFKDGYGGWENHKNNDILDNNLTANQDYTGSSRTEYEKTSDFDNITKYDMAELEFKGSAFREYPADNEDREIKVDVWDNEWVNIHTKVYNSEAEVETLDLSEYISDDFNIRIGLEYSEGNFGYMGWTSVEYTNFRFWLSDLVDEPSESEYTPEENFNNDNWNVENGNLTNTGDLSEVDGNYTSLEPQYDEEHTIYDFENETVGTKPEGAWDCSGDSGNNNEIEIVEDANESRNKVLKMDDSETTMADKIDVRNHYKETDHGTTRHYFKWSDQPWYFELMGDDGSMVEINVRNGEITNRKSNKNYEFFDIHLDMDKWYYLELDFEFSSGGYKGLGSDEINVSVTDTETNQTENFHTGNLRGGDCTTTDYIRWQGGSSSMPTIYVDDVWHNWEAKTLDHYLNATLKNKYKYEDPNILEYNLKTDIRQKINVSLYNYDLDTYDSIDYKYFSDFSNNEFNLNSSYFNENNEIKLNFYGFNETNDFELQIDKLVILEEPHLKYYEYYQLLDFDFDIEIGRIDIIDSILSDFDLSLIDTISNVSLKYDDYSDYFNLFYYMDEEFHKLDIDDFEDNDPDTVQDQIPKEALYGNTIQLKIKFEYWKPFDIELDSVGAEFQYETKDNVGYHRITSTYTNGATEIMTMDIYRDYLFIDFEEMMDREYSFSLNETENLEIQTHFRINDEGEAVMRLHIVYNQEEDDSVDLYFRDDGFGEHMVVERFNYTYNNPLTEMYDGKEQTTYYPILTGFRDLYTDETDFNRFIDIPLYSESIDVEAEEKEKTEQDEADEPEPPKGEKHWDMPTWKIDTIETVEISHGNFTFDYDKIGPVAETTEFGYDDETIEPIKASDWGDWGVNNWMRDLFAMLLNLLIVVINQFILWVVYGSLYAVNLALNWFFVGLIVGIIVCFFWNYPIYWVVDSSVMLGWFIWEALIVFIKWFWKDILEPAFEWLMDDFMPFFIDLWISVMVLIPALILTLIAGEPIGGEYFENIMDMGKELIYQAGELFTKSVGLFARNWAIFAGAFVFYLLGIGLLLTKYWFFNMKGDVEKAESAYLSASAFVRPFIIIMNIIKKIRDTTPNVAGTG
ncbi:MAG: hypothetical protein ACOC1X_00010 [Promethearchaeota archaeon]